MSIEAEASALFAAGVLIVLVAEVAISLIVFSKRPQARKALLGHSACLLLAFACIAYMMHAPKAPDGGSYNGSGLLALAGILWFAAECFVINTLMRKEKE